MEKHGCQNISKIKIIMLSWKQGNAKVASASKFQDFLKGYFKFFFSCLSNKTYHHKLLMY